ncbi:MAG: tetratricopeptide repeat protein [Promethearchaeota archaeon]
MDKKILDYISQGKSTFFVGAGISMISPSCLPSWWQVNHIILDSLTNEAVKVVPDLNELTNQIKQREEEGKLPPEFVAEIIVNRLGESYFDVLQGLEGDKPNQTHFWLATLAKAGMLRAIITTNFDTLIEQAFETLGVPISVLVDPEDYEKMDLSSPNKDIPCLLLKLHGTATRPSTCIDTLAERKRGFPPSIEKALDILGSQTFWIILGYSGADLDAEPNYLGIRKRMNDSPGFVWLHLPQTNPLPVVSELVQLYGSDRGLIKYGILPDWLSGLEAILPSEISAPQPINLSPQQIQDIKTENTKKVEEHARNWAKERESIFSGVILADIGIKAANPTAAQKVFLDLLNIEKNEELDLQLLPFGSAILYSGLGELSKTFGNYREALTYYQKAAQCFEEAEHADGRAIALHEIATLLQNFGEYQQAEEILKQYLEYSRDSKDPDSYIHAIMALGNFYYETEELKNSSELFQEAIQLSAQHGLEVLRARSMLNLANIEFELGKPTEAENKVTQAIEIMSRLGDEKFLSRAYRHLANINWQKGNVDKSYELLEQAKEKAELVGDEEGKIQTERAIGKNLYKQGKYPEAETILQKTAEKTEQMEKIELLLVLWQDLGYVYQMQNKITESVDIYQKTIKKAEEMGLESKAAGVRVNLGIIYEQHGQFEQALENYQSAYEVFSRSGKLDAIAGAQGNIGNIYYRMEKFQEAKEYYEKALDTFGKIQDVEGIVRTLSNVANMNFQIGDISTAREQYEKVIRLADQSKQYEVRDATRFNLASVFFQLEDYTTSLELYKQIFESTKDRQDYLKAGLSIYYAGHTHLRMNNQEQAIKAIEQAITIWEMLEEKPPYLQDAKDFLQSLKE